MAARSQDEAPEKYQTHFKAWIDAGLDPEGIKGSDRFRLSGPNGRAQDEAPEKYQTHFKAWIDAGLDPDGIEGLVRFEAERPGCAQDEAPEKYQTHFKAWIDAGLDPDGIEDLYKEVHEAIRADPLAQKKERSTPDEKKKWKAAKLTYDERKAALKARPPAPAGSCCGPACAATEHAPCLHSCQQGYDLRCRVKARLRSQQAYPVQLKVMKQKPASMYFMMMQERLAALAEAGEGAEGGDAEEEEEEEDEEE